MAVMPNRLILFASLLVGHAAFADHQIVRVDEGLAYVDIGKRDGVAPGQALEVVDRATPTETFHLGWIVLDSCGDGLSMARVPEELRAHVKQGTVVRMPAHVAVAAPAPAAAPAVAAPPPPPAMHRAEFRHEKPGLSPPGVPLTLTAFVPQELGAPTLMWRAVGDHTYNALPFAAKPDDYYTVAIGPESVQAPGLEYYIVVDGPDAPRALAYGDPAAPARVDVEGRFNATTELARYGASEELSTIGELVSYHVKGANPDYYYRFEGEYLHRIFKTIYSMRFGAGYLNGRTTDTGTMVPQTIGFLYAYSEAEVRSSEMPLAFLPRLIFGVNDSGVGGGFEGRVRIGDELGMNFEAGLTILSRLGFETFTTLTLHPTRRASVSLAAYLENLPVNTDLGFRSYVDVRYRLQGSWSTTLRVGVAARSINTIGPDTGLGIAYGF